MATGIPTTLADLRPAWLGDALGCAVASYGLERIGVGVGIMGDLARITPRYAEERPDLPKSVVVKVKASSDLNAGMCFSMGFYEREVRFYREVARDLSIRVPACFRAELDVPGQRFALVLEDLQGYELLDGLDGIPFEEAVRAVECIAEFHADWWDAPGLDALDWLPRTNDPVTLGYGEYYRRSWPAFVENFGADLSPEALEAGKAGGERQEDLLHALASPHTTIVHNDFKLDNLFFGADGGVVIIDWQVITRGRGISDVAYLLSQSMEPRLRRSHERELLERWHAVLCRRGVTGYGMDDVWRDYQRAILRNLAIPVEMGGAMDLGNARGVEMVRTIVKRAFSAAVETDALAALP